MHGGAGVTAVVMNRVRRGFYLDSVALMRHSGRIASLPGVEAASLMIGTEANRRILDEAGLLADGGRSAGPDDLVIGVRARDGETAEAALAAALDALEDAPVPSRNHAGALRPRRLDSALERLPDANLALISVPGEFAAAEARRALERGLNVMIFSDNVPLEAERALKEEARARGLLVMGPDCGTALLHGVPLAFANAIPRGTVGAIAAAGTGLQEFSVLLARGSGGLSHGIGVGGRDLSDAIGGLTTLAAIDALEADPDTHHLVVISKPPGKETAQRVLARLARVRKPVTACFIGLEQAAVPAGVDFAPTLRAAARQALGADCTDGGFSPPAVARTVHAPPEGRFIRGLYSGGTLCAEAQVLLRAAGLDVLSNAPIAGVERAAKPDDPVHTVLDLGADEYTVGRPHPMIEPAVRSVPLAHVLTDRRTGVVLLDVILGYGAHPDPAGAVVEALARQRPADAPPDLPPVVASVCGVPGDPQGYEDQVRKLRDAGVILAPSNAEAVEVAIRIAARDPTRNT